MEIELKKIHVRDLYKDYADDAEDGVREKKLRCISLRTPSSVSFAKTEIALFAKHAYSDHSIA